MGRVALATLALLLAWDSQRWERGEEDQRRGDRPLEYREWSRQRCNFDCHDRQFQWRQRQEERR